MNNELVKVEQTMSSREIAELCGKEHKVVLRDIRVMLVELHGKDEVERRIPDHKRNRHSEFVRENADAILNAITGEDGTKRHHEQKQGFTWTRDNRGYITLFNLDKDHTTCLVTGYDVNARMKIIKRWQELESKQVDQLESLPPEQRALVQLMVSQAETNKRLAITEDKVKRIEAKQAAFEDGSKFFTIVGYINYRGLDHVPFAECARLGKKATKLSKEQGLLIDKVRDPRFGVVGSYHESILEQIFNEEIEGM